MWAAYPGGGRRRRSGAWTCRLPPGRRVAVVGPSGAGKSTLAAVLAPLPALAGRFGHAERDADSTGWPATTCAPSSGLVGQDAYLFDTTIAENLRIGRRDATDAELAEVLDRVGLAGWLGGLPAGAGDRGRPARARLSGGQRQRVAVARALLADFPVLVLDEPAEHLDPAAADALTADLLGRHRRAARWY